MSDFLKKIGLRYFVYLAVFILAFALTMQIIQVIAINDVETKASQSFDKVSESVDNIAFDTLNSNYDTFLKDLLDVEVNSIEYVFSGMVYDTKYLSDIATYTYKQYDSNGRSFHQKKDDTVKKSIIYYLDGVDANKKSIQDETNILSSLEDALYFTASDSGQKISAYILTESGISAYSSSDLENVNPNNKIDFRKSEFYQECIATSSCLINDSEIDYITGKRVISMYKSIYVDGVPKGVAGIDILVESLDFVNMALKVPDEFNLFMADLDGEIIYNARRKVYNADEAKKGTAYEFIKSSVKKNKGFGFYQYRGNDYRTFYKKISGAPYTLFVSIRANKIKNRVASLSNLLNDNNSYLLSSFSKASKNMIVYQFILMIVVLIIIFIIARYVSKKMESPLAELSELLNTAKRIQQNMLPKAFDSISNRKDIAVYAENIPEAEVGGDFYNYIIKNNLLFLIIADVSGSGIPAALFMAKTSELLENAIDLSNSPKVILSYVNDELCKNNNENYFVTLALYCVDLTTRKVISANSGHEDAMIIKKDGSIQILNETRCAPMGLNEFNNYVEDEFSLDVDDVLFLYTDGVVEAINKNNELYGVKRLTKKLSSEKIKDLKGIIEYIKNDINEYSKGLEQYDDITMLCFKFNDMSGDPTLIYNFEKDFKTVYESVDLINDFMRESLEKVYSDDRKKYIDYINKISVCNEELIVNIIDYAYEKKNDENNIKVKIEIDKNVDKLTITFIDSGKQFDPSKAEDPNILRGLEEQKEGGFGMFITRKTMDAMIYKYENGQNVLAIVKFL